MIFSGTQCCRLCPQGAEELFVMAREAKTLQPIARVASVERIDYELDVSNRHAIVLNNDTKKETSLSACVFITC